jgi:F0F1-type ATP synthase membrane subunit b/b'
MEIVTSWMERGITQGIRQGIEREMALVLRQVNRRLGGVNPTLEAQIRDLSIEKVEDLGEALLDFQTEADLVNWLNRN